MLKTTNSYIINFKKYIYSIFNNNTFHQIYYGTFNPYFIINFNKNNLLNSVDKSKINSKKNLDKNNKDIYSLTIIKNENPYKNLFSNLYYALKNKIYTKFQKSDTKILLNDFLTSYDNLSYNFQFYLNPNIYNKITYISNLDLTSHTSKALTKIKTGFKNLDLIELENILKYFYEKMLKNNFYDLESNNKNFCSDSAILVLQTIYKDNKKFPIEIGFPDIIESLIINNEIKYMKFKIIIKEFNIKTNKIEKNTYLFDIKENTEKQNVKKQGFNFIINNIQLLESVNNLI